MSTRLKFEDRLDPIERVLERVENTRRSGSGWKARCPAHDDRDPSLSIDACEDGRVLLHCHAGCSPEAIVSAIGLKMADLFPRRPAAIKDNGQSRGAKREGDHTPAKNTATAQRAGLTLAQYAEAKQLDPNRLRAFGLSDITYSRQPAVRIPYLDEDGNEAAVRFRLRLDKSEDGDDRFRWKSGTKVCLYGRDRLEQVRKRGYIVLVEGESDCHTL